MLALASTLLNAAGTLASAGLFGLFKPPPPVMPPPDAIARVAVTAEMTAAKCDLNPTQVRNGQKYDATALDKRASLKRQKAKDGGDVELMVRAKAKYYSNLYFEAIATQNKPVVVNLVLKDTSYPIPENYIILGATAYKMPATWQYIQTPCIVPKGQIMTFCTNPTFVRAALNRDLLEQMAASGSQQIRWVSRSGGGDLYRCNYLSADEAKAVLTSIAAR